MPNASPPHRAYLQGESLLVLGATGHIGRVLAAQVLASSGCHLLLPLRAHHKPRAVWEAIAGEDPTLTADVVRRRTTVVVLPRSILDLLSLCKAVGVRGVLHCAGSMNDSDPAALWASNEELTRSAIALGQALEVEYFAYVSTAFASGHRRGLIPETLHAQPDSDPSAYTASKRACEHLVARSGLPSLIVRPSVVIGDSRTGRYTGRLSGIYQLWRGFERLLSHQWQETAHAVVSDRQLQVVHQDAVAERVVAALQRFEPGRILHLVSAPGSLPTVRQAWSLWFEHLVRPATVRLHRSAAAAQAEPMSSCQRILLDVTSSNLRIAEHDWAFQTSGLRRLGEPLPVANAISLLRCQQAFVAGSPRLQAYLASAPGTRGGRFGSSGLPRAAGAWG